MNVATTFFKNYKILIVCIPGLAALHYGWYRMQFNEDFVSSAEKKILELPGTGKSLHLDDFSLGKSTRAK